MERLEMEEEEKQRKRRKYKGQMDSEIRRRYGF